jgi:hypothetical protein
MIVAVANLIGVVAHYARVSFDQKSRQAGDERGLQNYKICGDLRYMA